MIFQHTLDNVLAERKTQTRRVIHSGDAEIRGRYNRIEAVLTNGRLKWVVGRTYAVQAGRCEPPIARIQITKINSQCVKYISTRDAIEEGFSSKREFLETWKKIHGPNSLDLRVWIVNFKLVAEAIEGYPTADIINIKDKLEVSISDANRRPGYSR